MSSPGAWVLRLSDGYVTDDNADALLSELLTDRSDVGPVPLLGLLRGAGHVNIAGPRNQLTTTFLASDAEWSVWVDSDVTPEPGVIRSLLARAVGAGVHIASSLSVTDWHDSDRLVVHPCVATGRNAAGQLVTDRAQVFDWVRNGPSLVEVPAVGFGCVAIHRKVYAAIALRSGRRDYWFRNEWNEDDDELGEDYRFGVVAAEAGFPTYLAPDLHTIHRKSIDLTVGHFTNQYRAKVAT